MTIMRQVMLGQAGGSFKNLLTSHSCAISWKKVGPFLINLIAWQLLLDTSHCIPLSLHSVSSHLISSNFISSCLKSSLFSIGSGPRSSLQLLSTEQSCADPFSFYLFLTIFCGPSTLFPSSLPNSPLVLPYLVQAFCGSGCTRAN